MSKMKEKFMEEREREAIEEQRTKPYESLQEREITQSVKFHSVRPAKQENEGAYADDDI